MAVKQYQKDPSEGWLTELEDHEQAVGSQTGASRFHLASVAALELGRWYFRVHAVTVDSSEPPM